MRFLLVNIFIILCLISMLFLFTNGKQAKVNKPGITFRYVEKRVVEIKYVENSANDTLCVCCKSPDFDDGAFLESDYCPPAIDKSCPEYMSITTYCDKCGKQVCCKIDYVLKDTTIRAYVGRIGEKKVSPDRIATFVTNKSEIYPKPVANLAITTNSQQGLDISWKPFTTDDYNGKPQYYNTVVQCEPLENRGAKAVKREVELMTFNTKIRSRDITAISKYKCCVHVVNYLGMPSELTCRNVTTSEQAPVVAPIITCGNDTGCPYIRHGSHKRNITIFFQLPKERYGKVARYEVFHKNVNSVNLTKIVIYNGSASEAVIKDVETGESYDVYMRYCNKLGCSQVSNTIRIPAVSFYKNVTTPVVAIVLGLAACVVTVLLIIGYYLRRHKRLQRLKTLPKLEEQKPSVYEYPVIANKDTEEYDELRHDKNVGNTSDISPEGNLVICNDDVIIKDSGDTVVDAC